MLFLRTADSTGRLKADQRARLQIKRMRFYHQDTFEYSISVQADGRVSRLTTVNEVDATDGSLRVPVLTQNTQATINILNDSPRPSWLTGADWEGEVHARNALR